MAEQDLYDILAYIAFALQSPLNASGQLGRLERGISSLESLPGRFCAHEREPWKSRGLRTMLVDQYLVFYIPDFETETVTVLRIMYSGRNVERQL